MRVEYGGTFYASRVSGREDGTQAAGRVRQAGGKRRGDENDEAKSVQ